METMGHQCIIVIISAFCTAAAIGSTAGQLYAEQS